MRRVVESELQLLKSHAELWFFMRKPVERLFVALIISPQKQFVNTFFEKIRTNFHKKSRTLHRRGTTLILNFISDFRMLYWEFEI